jgi:hypothetical protein
MCGKAPRTIGFVRRAWVRQPVEDFLTLLIRPPSQFGSRRQNASCESMGLAQFFIDTDVRDF